MKRGYQITAALTALFLAGTAQAHTFGAHDAGFAAGLAHPFIGLDHLLAILAVGVWVAVLRRWVRFSGLNREESRIVNRPTRRRGENTEMF